METVDWSKFKSSAKGKNLEKSKSGYARFYLRCVELGYVLLSDYTGTHRKVDIRCNKGHITSKAPSDLLSGYLCGECFAKTPEKSKADLIKKAKLRGYTITGTYKGNDKPIKMICNKGHEIKIRPNDFKQGKGCIYCGGRSKELAKSDFEKLAESLGYSIVDEYENTDTPLNMVCDKGHNCKISPSNFKRGVRCGCTNKGGFDANKDAYIYIIASKCKSMMKIGITNKKKNKTIRRFSDIRRNSGVDFDVLHTLYFKSGGTARFIEALSHRNGVLIGLLQNDGYVSKEWLRYDESLINKVVQSNSELRDVVYYDDIAERVAAWFTTK